MKIETIYNTAKWLLWGIDKMSENCYDNNRYKAIVLRWLDGDTLKLRVDLGQGVNVENKYRLARIDAPEVKKYRGVTNEEKQRGIDLTKQLEDKIPAGTEVEISTYKKGKYGRYVIDIWLKEDDAEYNLSNWLITEGLVEYAEY